MQQMRADFSPDSFGSLLTAVAAMVCISQLSCQIALRFQLPAKRGLVQIANALTEQAATEIPRE